MGLSHFEEFLEHTEVTVVWLLSRNFRNEPHQWAGLRYFQDVSRKYDKIQLCSSISQARCNQEQETNMYGRDVYQRIYTEKRATYAMFSSLQAVVISGSDIVGSSIHFRDFQGYSFLIFLYSLEIMGNHNCKSSFGGTCFLDFPTIFTTNLRSADRSFIFSKVAHLAAVDHGKSLGTGGDTWQEAHMGFFATSLVVDRGMIV